MTIWSILRPLEIFYGHLVYFVVIWYIFPPLGILDQEKSGNLECNAKDCFLFVGCQWNRHWFYNNVMIKQKAVQTLLFSTTAGF
jgi:hypothetical protein